MAEKRDVRHLILMCSAVNAIDASALESLEMINRRLADAGVCLHLSEVKGPVMDALERSHLLDGLSGKVWLSQHEAFTKVIALADREQESLAAPDLWAARGAI
ncbi:sodium-independent anion transporter [Sphingobium yanoikuyae]|uniref:sodium-independent anion transporter n=1 Tax=Sphingomonadales TaxID=204457 RepID=UPI00240EDD5D|nr:MULTISPECIES: sodium-independent anion transporter [Sphingomonadaceae]MDG2515923.1 sodium-independent anion transporter [Sphingobium yanoikuyae]